MYEMTAKIHEQLGARHKPASDEFEQAFDAEMETQRQRVMNRLFIDLPKARELADELDQHVATLEHVAESVGDHRPLAAAGDDHAVGRGVAVDRLSGVALDQHQGGAGQQDQPLAGAVGSPGGLLALAGDRAWGVRVHDREEEADAVISTAPVHILAKLVQGSEAVKHLARQLSTGRRGPLVWPRQ